MNESRIKRYRDKINLITKRREEINEWIGIGSHDFVKDEKTKLATYKAFQEAVEACMDIVAMMCKDSAITPKDDYTNIDTLAEEMDLYSTEKSLKEANGLRNRLVHRYNTMDDLLAYESINNLLPEIAQFTERVSQWMRERLNK